MLNSFYQEAAAQQKNTVESKQAYNPSMSYQQEKVIRGSSFLCNDEYCSGYRNSRRMGSIADTSLNHTGFRCVKTTQ